MLALAVVSGRVAAQTDDATEPAVRLALVEAIRARMGEAAQVELGDVTMTFSITPDIVTLKAAVEPGALLGRPVRFALTSEVERQGQRRASRVGRAIAEVTVSIPHVRAATDIRRGALLSEADLVLVDAEVTGVPVDALPQLADLVGARVTRQLQADTVVAGHLARMPPLVKSGDRVRTRAVVGGVEVTGFAVAQQSGHRHDRIRLVNPESRRVITGVVVGIGEVEVGREY